MDNYQNIAIIVVRGIAVSFLFSTMIEVGIIASDILFVKAGVYYQSEIAFRPRLLLCTFYFLASMFLFTQSKMIAKSLVQGLFEKKDDEVINDEESTQQNNDTTENEEKT